MRILMLNYEFPPLGGGAAPVSYDIGKRLAERGHSITVVTMGYKDLPDIENNDGMEIHRVKCLRKKKMVCHPWEQATYIVSAYRYVRKNFEIDSFDLCYTHFIIPTGVISLKLKKKYGLEYIITAHGSDVIGHNNKRFGFLYKLIKQPWKKIVREAKCVVAPSQYLMELMEKTEPKGKYEVIRNGIDTSFYVRTNDKKKRILVMCRLQETKNVQCIIEAIKDMETKDWVIDVLGDGPYKEVLEQSVHEYGIEEKIKFLGWVDNRSPKQLKTLQEASILLSASRVENCPTSILEAISCGAHVLLSDIPAHIQMMDGIDEDIFFKDNDAESLKDKLTRLISIIEEKKEYFNRYEIQNLDWEKSIDEYEKIMKWKE